MLRSRRTRSWMTGCPKKLGGLLGGEGVVGAAAHGDVVEAMFAAVRKSYRVV
jgi:hypothetical protein